MGALPPTSRLPPMDTSLYAALQSFEECRQRFSKVIAVSFDAVRLGCDFNQVSVRNQRCQSLRNGERMHQIASVPRERAQ